jgi:hypothetical protein
MRGKARANIQVFVFLICKQQDGGGKNLPVQEPGRKKNSNFILVMD